MDHKLPVSLSTAALALASSLFSCGTRAAPLLPWERDLRPPCILGLRMEAEDAVMLCLDEEGLLEGGGVLWDPEGMRVDIQDHSKEGFPVRDILLRPGRSLVPGAEYLLEGRVADAEGNSQAFLLPFWGFNPRPAGLLINEVRTESSSPRCDMVELFVKWSGSSAGTCLISGSPADPDWRWRLPALELSAGDYLVLHLKAAPGIPAVDDISALDQATGPDCGALWRDLWYPGEAALPGANGCLCLLGGPTGPILDALCYSERTSASDERYGGFGSARFKARVAEIVASGAWRAEASPPRPEDCAGSAGVTETRTLCRSSDSIDGDRRSDWHVAPTKGATWGGANRDEVFSLQLSRKKP